jgi:hypothetical protein
MSPVPAAAAHCSTSKAWRRRQEGLGVWIVEQSVGAAALLRAHQRHTERGLAHTGRNPTIAHPANLSRVAPGG